ncbi:vacuolar protein sorting/targeting protein PEP1 [Boothiomyces macroporosus]|uniref:Vacuolar protein sorting/targeting protein PEP1 n=1 Tax=Boothiomyces macroporosus TaxID=261099 RepID=A0AAD5UMH6_9FUNG|nr:vacuolar protein sorting/targeting protein PEP1 [Boothiomyces macroporosus]
MKYKFLPLLFYQLGTVLAGDPSFEKTEFDSTANELFYFDDSKAFAFGETDYYVTTDQGSIWTKFDTVRPIATPFSNALSFHPNDPNRVIVRIKECNKGYCHDDAFYTLDNFKTLKPLLTWIAQCEWGQNINSKESSLDKKIFCTQWPTMEQEGDAGWKDPSILELVSSDNYFADNSKSVIVLDGGVPVIGISSNWFIAVVKPPSSPYQLVTSKDGTNFLKAPFDLGSTSRHPVAFSILESTPSSLVVDVISTTPNSQLPAPFGTLFMSSSDGSYFAKVLDYTNRDITRGLIDFERIQASIYEGIMLSNTVKNWKEVLDRSASVKKLASVMSFDNGRRWTSITPPTKDSNDKDYSCKSKDECSLHLHSVTTSNNIGRVFSVSSAPGTILGVGNVGPHLLPYEECDTFLSEDSGVTWREVKKGPHKYEILNYGSTIVLIPDSSTPSNHISYSKNGGKEWKEFPLKVEDSDWIPLFTDLDTLSTSQKMILFVSLKIKTGRKYLVHLDFEGIFDRKCDSTQSTSNNDLELWKPKTPTNSCVLGSLVSYYRRKLDADCAVGEKFKLLGNEISSCECTDADYECDIGFKPKEGSEKLECIAAGNINDQPLECKLGTKYPGLSGYRLIPGDLCKGGDDKKANKIEKECKAVSSKPPQDPIPVVTTFSDKAFEIVRRSTEMGVFALIRNGELWSSLDEKSWKKVDTQGKNIVRIVPHETKDSRIFLLSEVEMYVCDGKFEKLDQCALLKTPEPYNTLGIPIIDFHPTKDDWYVYVAGGRDCQSATCFTKAYFSKDNGKSFSEIETWVSKCVWSQDLQFKDKNIPEDAIYCSSFKKKDGKVGQDRLVGSKENPVQLLMYTDGAKSKKELISENVLDYYVVDKVLLVATNEASDPVLVSSVDGQTFTAVSFPPDVSPKKTGFTLLDSPTGGIFIDIAQTNKHGLEYGMLFRSNEKGDYFSKVLENTNRNSESKVDFQKMPGIPGIAIANKVKNIGSADKDVESVITFDNGLTWSSIIAPEKDSTGKTIECPTKPCKLHFHLTAKRQMGSPIVISEEDSAAGLMIGIGNPGDSLLEYDQGDVYITRDAGRTWAEVHKDAHIWTVADNGGLIVLVNDEQSTNTVTYSWDFGVSWAEFKFAEKPVRVESISSRDGSSQVLVSGHYLNSLENVVINLDFSKIFSRECNVQDSSKDFEKWYPAATKNSKQCFFGEEKAFLRRKADSVCRIGPKFNPEVPNPAKCECTEEDFECDEGFFRNGDKCELYGKDPLQPKDCISGNKYEGSSGYVKLSLSKCSGGIDHSKKVERVCDAPPALPHQVKVSHFKFDSPVDDFFYFPNTKNILAKDVKHQAYLSKDEGYTWKKVLHDAGSIIGIVADENFSSRAFIVTPDLLWYTKDNGESFQGINIPSPPYIHLASDFIIPHPHKEEWLIWIGGVDCSGEQVRCRSEAKVSYNYGKSWSLLGDYVKTCKWGMTGNFNSPSEKTVFCTIFEPKSGNQQSLTKMMLKRSDNGDTNFKTLYQATGFAFEHEYLIVAVPNSETREVKVQVSLDGVNFAQAKFPTTFAVHDGYTVLESPTGNVFLHMIQSIYPGLEYGTIVKSNWNGTFYHESLEAVNQNRNGYVDFEKVQGLNGTMIANVISNVDGLSKGESKKLVTKMSHDDAESFAFLPAPKLDSNNKPYDCGNSCYLHLHAFTERHDKRDMFSSSGAVGVMLGVGNVGSHLTDFVEGDVFLTLDAGRSWREVAKEAHMIEISDHGAIIVLANDEEPINSIKYSVDSGKTFKELSFADKLEGGKFKIQNILTEPSGTTQNFVLLGRLHTSEVEDTTIGIHLDFSNIWSRKCEMNEDKFKSDFEPWSYNNATDPSSCTFGAEVEFYRRKEGRECYIGDTYTQLKQVLKPCQCTMADFECDQFHRREGNECVLIPGVTIPNPTCVNGFIKKYNGYVKKKISQCQGGKDMSPITDTCSTGSSISWFLFFLFAVPLTAGALYMLYLYQRGGMGRYGRIGLPLDDGIPIGQSRSTFTKVMNTVSYYVEEIGEKIVGFGVWAWDSIRNRVRRNSGYAPVNSHYYDPDLPADHRNSLQLDWDED